jgi:uncharacterized protein (TIGR03435 family)
MNTGLFNRSTARPTPVLALMALLAAAAPAALGAGHTTLQAQPAVADQAPPAFEVASVKPNKSVDGRRNASFAPGRFSQTNVTVRQLLQMAYSRRAFDVRVITGGPDWIDADRFDITARVDGPLETLYLPDGKGSPGLAYLMLRTLLADRFRVAIHTETRTLPVYALVMARRDSRPGPQLHRSAVDCAAALAAMAATVATTGRPAPLDPGQGPPCSIGPRPGHLTGNAVTLSQLADVLSSSVSRAVVDRTGLTGAFDLQLDWTPDQFAAVPDAASATNRSTDSNVSIVTALQEQLGLKLKPARAPVDVLVVDRAERPTPD